MAFATAWFVLLSISSPRYCHPFKSRVVDSVIECWGQFLIGNAQDFALADIEIKLRP